MFACRYTRFQGMFSSLPHFPRSQELSVKATRPVPCPAIGQSIKPGSAAMWLAQATLACHIHKFASLLCVCLCVWQAESIVAPCYYLLLPTWRCKHLNVFLMLLPEKLLANFYTTFGLFLPLFLPLSLFLLAFLFLLFYCLALACFLGTHSHTHTCTVRQSLTHRLGMRLPGLVCNTYCAIMLQDIQAKHFPPLKIVLSFQMEFRNFNAFQQ